MGITIVNNNTIKTAKKKSVKALILAGGAVTGGSFMAGGVKALNDYLANYSVNDFDIYVGISAGSLLAAPISGGLPPEEILKSLDGTSKHFSELSPMHFYWPNWQEFVTRPINYCLNQIATLPSFIIDFISGMPKLYGDFMTDIKGLVMRPSKTSYERLFNTVLKHFNLGTLPSWIEILPSGVFDNSQIERYLRKNIERNHLTNNFKVAQKLSGKRLYISAMALDGAKRVVFGPDENNDATISQAVQASTAMPGFYKPARVNGVDYVDGGVQETANIDIAIDKGADLVICYNPFRPFDNKVFLEYIRKENRYVSGKHLSNDGVMAVLNQIFRALFHTRLHVIMEQYQKSKVFKGDIVLIEPEADDAAFFELNPLIFGNRVKAAGLGYQSVHRSIGKHYTAVSNTLKKYGITMNKNKVEKEVKKIKGAVNNNGVLQDLIESKKQKTPKKGKVI